MTVNAVLHAAWGILLSRHSGTADAVFGTVMTGRSGHVPGAEQMVGMLMNTLPSRVSVNPRAPASDLIQDVHRQLVEMRGYEHCALVDIQRHSQIPACQPMFGSIFIFQNFTAAGNRGRLPPHHPRGKLRANRLPAGRPGPAKPQADPEPGLPAVPA